MSAYDHTATLVRGGFEWKDTAKGWFLFSPNVPKRILKKPRDTGRGDEDIYTFDVYERREDGRFHFKGVEERFQYTGKVELKENKS